MNQFGSICKTLLGLHGLLQLTIKVIALSDWCGALSYEWDEKEQKLVQKSWINLLYYKLHLLASFIYVFLTFVQVAVTWQNVPFMVITHNNMFLTCGIIKISVHFVSLTKIKSVAALFNCFIDYETRHRIEFSLDLKSEKRCCI